MSIAKTALASLMRAAGRDDPDFVEFEDGPPALATRFAADEAAAAAIAAGGVIAADLWRLRGGDSQGVRVSTREAAAGLVGLTLQRFSDDARAPTLAFGHAGKAANGFTRTRDGRSLYLHPSFPESTKRLLATLGCDDTREAVVAAVGARESWELEDAIAQAGACAAVARTPEEWDASDQGRVMAARPVVEVVKIADSPPEPLPSRGDKPLSGVRALDLTRVLAGPTCGRTLASYGAEVLLISGPNLPFVAPFVSDTSTGKRSAFLDLATADGRARLRDLVQGADIFTQGYRVGSLDRAGFGPLDLAALRPGLIYTSINCYGHEGPWRGRPGWEQLAQTATGMAHMHGEPGQPALQPGAVTDYTTGFLAAFGTLVALHRRAVWGGSYLVRVSLSQTAMWVRGLGFAGPERLDAVRPFDGDELRGWMITTEGGYGPMTHLRPPARLDATPTAWARGSYPLGAHPPAWLDD